MGAHPVNLAVRFLLELGALAVLGAWGWNQGGGMSRYVAAFGLPLATAVLWGTFAVPHDPSRSGGAPIAIPGVARLVLELAVFIAGTVALFSLGRTGLGWLYGITAGLHNVLSYDRITWLLRQ